MIIYIIQGINNEIMKCIVTVSIV